MPLWPCSWRWAMTGSPWTRWPARPRASKATLYRRWNTKNDLVIDALVRAEDHAARRVRHRVHCVGT